MIGISHVSHFTNKTGATLLVRRPSLGMLLSNFLIFTNPFYDHFTADNKFSRSAPVILRIHFTTILRRIMRIHSRSFYGA